MLRSALLIFFFLFHFESVFAIEKLNILGLFKDKAIVQIDGKQRLLTVWKKSPEGVSLISANSRKAIPEIEDERKTYTIGTHISGKFNNPKSRAISTIAPDSNGMY
jgi:aspartyl protease family protein